MREYNNFQISIIHFQKVDDMKEKYFRRRLNIFIWGKKQELY